MHEEAKRANKLIYWVRQIHLKVQGQLDKSPKTIQTSP